MSKPQIKVILGSIREGRAGEKVAQWVMSKLQNETRADISLLDLKDYPMPLFADAVPPSMRQGPHPNPDVQKWLDQIDSADGYLIITPEYNHSFPSALKNALDYGYKEWNEKTVGFVSYGGLAGGSRAVEHLRQVAAELHMYDVRDQVMIPMIWTAFAPDGTLQHSESLEKNLLLMVTNVIELASKLGNKK